MDGAEQKSLGEKDASADDAVERLWVYATALYGVSGVARACLDAQNQHGMDVNMLLFAVWLADRRRPLSAAQVEEAVGYCQPWRRDVILPLRRQRRSWQQDPHRQLDYEAIKALEISAEREQLRRLAVLSESPRWALPTNQLEDHPAEELLAENLHQVAKVCGSTGSVLDSLRQAIRGATTQKG